MERWACLSSGWQHQHQSPGTCWRLGFLDPIQICWVRTSGLGMGPRHLCLNKPSGDPVHVLKFDFKVDWKARAPWTGVPAQSTPSPLRFSFLYIWRVMSTLQLAGVVWGLNGVLSPGCLDQRLTHGNSSINVRTRGVYACAVTSSLGGNGILVKLGAHHLASSHTIKENSHISSLYLAGSQK